MINNYSLSDSSLAITFATFLWQNVQVFHPNLANMLGALLHVCINIFFVSTHVEFLHREIKILRQVEIVVILMPIIFRLIYAIFWSVWNEIIQGYAIPLVNLNAV